MYQNSKHAGNMVLLRGATLWLLVALVLAWCLVFMKLEVTIIKMIFKDFHRLLQGHIDFLLMSALILGFYAAKVPLPWHVQWPMVIGAFTNSSLFLMQSMFPVLEAPAEGIFSMAFRIFLMLSLTITTYGFGMGAIIIFRSTLKTASSD
ncbi:hypothetical protein [Methylobacter sp. S3L5C]|uniref:hypothetical protein n=1 Tax=Methylobacter sp. S3L5C TaxID=2839024 RepID=UPI001FADB833|nr:hypothetical protein [Methylobacter sp. S3L5C]UOA09144.1 hypothetical protein KKZ03_02145 [Methylobacter sp. S3L5C]